MGGGEKGHRLIAVCFERNITVSTSKKCRCFNKNVFQILYEITRTRAGNFSADFEGKKGQKN